MFCGLLYYRSICSTYSYTLFYYDNLAFISMTEIIHSEQVIFSLINFQN